MRKVAVVLVLVSVVAVIAVRFVRNDEQPPMVGSWRELRPPDFA